MAKPQRLLRLQRKFLLIRTEIKNLRVLCVLGEGTRDRLGMSSGHLLGDLDVLHAAFV